LKCCSGEKNTCNILYGNADTLSGACGGQVDSFLIANSTATQTFHAAEYIEDNPVLKPDMPWEGTFAMPFSGGSWWEDEQERIALWYRCGGGYAGDGVAAHAAAKGRSGPSDTGTCVAYSKDGITWEKPLQDVVNGTNFVRRVAYDGNTVWLGECSRTQ
jgi:hypothetical protein